MVLANALYKASLEMDQTYNPATGHILPELPLHRARFIMTRSDFIRKHHDLSRRQRANATRLQRDLRRTWI
jgi:hypothetical protein